MKKTINKLTIGVIGTGFIGGNMSTNFEERGYEVIRYSLEPPYNENKDKIRDCYITFIAVPTPTTPEGFSYDILEDVLSLIGEGNIAVIKSTILPKVTNLLQKKYPKIYIFHSPEFLTESTAEYDVSNPQRNIIGIPVLDDNYKKKAQEILDILPKAPYSLICSAKEASFIKYGGNCFFYVKLIFMNMLYDLAKNTSSDINWDNIRNAMAAEKMIGKMHLDPIHKGGRGAGNHCLLKDMEAFKNLYKEMDFDKCGEHILDEIIKCKIDLIEQTLFIGKYKIKSK